MTELTPYPTLRVMDKRSPAVSPKVVAQIFMIQNAELMDGSFDSINFCFISLGKRIGGTLDYNSPSMLLNPDSWQDFHEIQICKENPKGHFEHELLGYLERIKGFQQSGDCRFAFSLDGRLGP